jgi:hypothetical protein
MTWITTLLMNASHMMGVSINVMGCMDAGVQTWNSDPVDMGNGRMEMGGGIATFSVSNNTKLTN